MAIIAGVTFGIAFSQVGKNIHPTERETYTGLCDGEGSTVTLPDVAVLCLGSFRAFFLFFILGEQ